MPRIFISYRRADSELITDRIYERLVEAFGESDVFLDVEPDNIPAGADFRKILQDAVVQCDIILVIIGPNWLNIKENSDPNVRRLDNENDFVRIEVKTGLEREQRDQILVIPVLVGGAQMPSDEDLPSDLQELAFRNARLVRRNPDFDLDMNRLIDRIKDYSRTNRQKSSVRIPRRFWVLGAALAALTVTVMLLIASNIIELTETTPQPTLDERSQAMTLVAQDQVATIEAGKTANIGAIMTSFVTETSVAIAAIGTTTADAYTDTPTVTPLPSNTPTEDYIATANAQMTLDAQATLNVPTNTPLPTSTSTMTPIPTNAPTTTLTSTLTVTANIGETQTTDALQLMMAQENAQATQNAVPTVKVTISTSVNLRIGPGTNYPVVATAFEGDSFPVIARSQDGWFLVVTPTNQRAWISSGTVEIFPNDSEVEIAVTIPYEPSTDEVRASFSIGQRIRTSRNSTPVRLNPGINNSPYMFIDPTQDYLYVTITGEPTVGLISRTDNSYGLWWPIRIEVDGRVDNGWIYQGNIQPY